MPYCLSGSFRHRRLSLHHLPLEVLGGEQAVCVADVVAACSRKEAVRRSEIMVRTMLTCQLFASHTACEFADRVLYSNGNHIHQHIRNSAVVAFWLPSIPMEPGVLRRRFDSRVLEEAFWAPRVDCFEDVFPYVQDRLPVLRAS